MMLYASATLALGVAALGSIPHSDESQRAPSRPARAANTAYFPDLHCRQPRNRGFPFDRIQPSDTRRHPEVLSLGFHSYLHGRSHAYSADRGSRRARRQDGPQLVVPAAMTSWEITGVVAWAFYRATNNRLMTADLWTGKRTGTKWFSATYAWFNRWNGKQFGQGFSANGDAVYGAPGSELAIGSVDRQAQQDRCALGTRLSLAMRQHKGQLTS